MGKMRMCIRICQAGPLRWLGQDKVGAEALPSVLDTKLPLSEGIAGAMERGPVERLQVHWVPGRI